MASPDRSSFEEQVAPLYPALVRRLGLVLRDPAEAQDVAQEAYLRAYRAWDRFDGRDPGAWLSTIALRLALNELRRRRRLFAFVATRRHESYEPSVEVDLWRALARIGPAQRAALLLNVVDGYTHVEIAEMLKVPVGTVASWLSRTKLRLRRDLEVPAP
jgi:RNA polymerase sigma-70 factor (ECF subfamily)